VWPISCAVAMLMQGICAPEAAVAFTEMVVFFQFCKVSRLKVFVQPLYVSTSQWTLAGTSGHLGEKHETVEHVVAVL
jgi:hypothetical protein